MKALSTIVCAALFIVLLGGCVNRGAKGWHKLTNPDGIEVSIHESQVLWSLEWWSDLYTL